jgi:phosphopantetheine--protein transferase-like protein
MLGIDLVHIPEFQKRLQTGGDLFLHKAFNPPELAKRDPEHLAGVWAAKEAVVKAGGLHIDHWTDIQVTYDKSGKPSAHVGDEHYDVSIAHHGEYAVAVAMKDPTHGA